MGHLTDPVTLLQGGVGRGLFPPFYFIYFFKDFIYLFLERGTEGGEKERERNGCVKETVTCALARNPGLCPDWESNW